MVRKANTVSYTHLDVYKRQELYGGLTKASKMNNPQPEPEMDWEDSSIGGEPAFVEEKIETVTSAASSTLYANEPVMEKGNQHLQFRCV